MFFDNNIIWSVASPRTLTAEADTSCDYRLGTTVNL